MKSTLSRMLNALCPCSCLFTISVLLCTALCIQRKMVRFIGRTRVQQNQPQLSSRKSLISPPFFPSLSLSLFRSSAELLRQFSATTRFFANFTARRTFGANLNGAGTTTTSVRLRRVANPLPYRGLSAENPRIDLCPCPRILKPTNVKILSSFTYGPTHRSTKFLLNPVCSTRQGSQSCLPRVSQIARRCPKSPAILQFVSRVTT